MFTKLISCCFAVDSYISPDEENLLNGENPVDEHMQLFEKRIESDRKEAETLKERAMQLRKEGKDNEAVQLFVKHKRIMANIQPIQKKIGNFEVLHGILRTRRIEKDINRMTMETVSALEREIPGIQDEGLAIREMERVKKVMDNHDHMDRVTDMGNLSQSVDVDDVDGNELDELDEMIRNRTVQKLQMLPIPNLELEKPPEGKGSDVTPDAVLEEFENVEL